MAIVTEAEASSVFLSFHTRFHVWFLISILNERKQITEDLIWIEFNIISLRKFYRHVPAGRATKKNRKQNRRQIIYSMRRGKLRRLNNRTRNLFIVFSVLVEIVWFFLMFAFESTSCICWQSFFDLPFWT